MSDVLLPYFNLELGQLRHAATEFAAAHPKIAGRLRLSPDTIDDPHVARLLEGVAFLSARIHHRLDDEFPEITEALLSVLYPHFLTPVPSTAIVQFKCQANLPGPLHLAAHLGLETELIRGEACRFRTAYPLTLWPVEIDTVRLTGLPLAAPANPQAQGARAVLRIGLTCTAAEGTFAQLGVDRLRFFLRASADTALPLYELLTQHTLSIAFADGIADPAPVIVPASALQPVGFAPEEALFPWPAQSFSGFRLLTEYFAQPAKFLFFDLDRIDAKTLVAAGNHLEIFIYLARGAPDLERGIGADTLALGCTPIVNLFAQHCEPVALTHSDIEYRIVPDARRTAGIEIWSVERVRETRPDGLQRPWRPFYRLAESDSEATIASSGCYHIIRRPSLAPLSGTDVYLAPHDPSFDPNAPAETALSVDAICLNRDLPVELPFGGGHPKLRLTAPAGPIESITAITAPGPTLRWTLGDQALWRLVTQLSLSHFSIAGGETAVAALREMLTLYDLRDTAETRAVRDSLVGISAKPGAARVTAGATRAFCRGLDVALEFDPRSWTTGAPYLLASVLERFLALHATVNSFVRTRAMLHGRPDHAALFPPRAGARVLL